MHQSDDSLGKPQLDYEAWRALVRSICARHNPEGIEPNAFLGWARPLSVCGLAAVDLGWNAHRIERTHRDVRLDGVEHYCALFQLAGQSTVAQNDQSVQLAVGDVALVDMGRPVTYFASNTSAQWLALHLPRQSLVSHLGFEPQGRFFRRDGTPPGRLLFQVVQDAVAGDGPPSSPADSYMQLAVYDFLGALFASSDPWPIARHTDKLFTRIRGVIKDRFADPEFGPGEVAAETGISLRYVQKLFTGRALPAVNSSILFVWIMPRAFCSAGHCWAQASLSARLPTPAVFATTLISHENFAIGSATRQAPTPENMVALRVSTGESAPWTRLGSASTRTRSHP